MTFAPVFPPPSPQPLPATTDNAPISFEVVRVLSTQVVTLLAVVIAADHNLKTWLAVRTLTAPTRLASTSTPLSRFQKIIRFILTFTIMCGFQFSVAFLLPRYGSTLALDVFWCVLVGLCSISSYHRTLEVLFPLSRTAQLVRVSERGKEDVGGKKMIVKFANAGDEARNKVNSRMKKGAAVVMSVGTLAAAWFESNVAPTALAFAFAITTVAVFYPKVVIKKMIYVLMGLFFGTPVLTVILVQIIGLFVKDKDTTSAPSENKVNFADAWVMNNVVAYALLAIPIIIPGTVISVTTRFEHSLHSPYHPLAQPGQAVTVPRELPAFSRPISTTGLVATVLVLVASAFTKVWDDEVPFPIFAALASTPVSVVAMALAALCTGQFKAWWNYSETWMPTDSSNDEEAEIASVDKELTKPLLEETETEVKEATEAN